jgi:RNA polymerase sigma factor for flagellar operon FliA
MGRRDDLWDQYVKTRDSAVRGEIIVQNLPLVRYVLGRLAIPALDDDVYNDLASQGILGLIDAVDRFEPKRGLRFSTYATLRIRGCILDTLRAMDTLPRSARKRVKGIDQAVSRLRMKLGREPRDEEVASAVNLDIKTYRAALVEANCAIFSIDASFKTDDTGDAFSFRDFLCDKDSPNPEEALERAELQQRLAAAFRRLSRRTQLLLSLYYYEGLTMKEIGQVLDLSESRVSQIHARAVISLRAALEQDKVVPRPEPSVQLPQRVPAPALAGG